MSDKEIFITCDCGYLEHLLHLSFFTDEKNKRDQIIYVQIFLHPNNGIFRRCWLAIKYIFGHKSNFGHFDEILLREPQVKKIKSFILEWEIIYGNPSEQNSIIKEIEI